MATAVAVRDRIWLASSSGGVYPLGAPRLAMDLNVDERKLRAWLREEYPDQAPGKGGEWVITIEIVIAAARQFE